jgi:hypothetical protein
MKDTLVEISQQRMDRCQNEQMWALAAYAATCAFVISEKDTFLEGLARGTLLIGLGIAGAAAFAFVLERKCEYYGYRNDMASLLKGEADAPDYMKKKKNPLCWNGVIWIAVFVIAVALPFGAAFYCLKEKPDKVSVTALTK